MADFVVGQRVRVCQYDVPWIDQNHFIVGHFGHVKAFDGKFIDVRIVCGPDGAVQFSPSRAR